MKQKDIKKVWIITTVFILMFFSNLFQNVHSNLLSFFYLMIIFASISFYIDYKRKHSIIKIDLNKKRKRFKFKSNLRKRNKSTSNLEYSDHESDAEYKGRMGEDRILDELEKLNFKCELIKNIILKKEEGTTEIDIILITHVGLYVFEVKNYRGWIFGSAISKKWTQSFYTGQKEHFMNPIHQNYGHIETLKQMLNGKYPNLNYYSVIVFTDHATLKQVPQSSTNLIIENESNLNRSLYASILNEQANQALIQLSYDDIEDVFCYLMDYRLFNPIDRKDHIDYLKSINDK